MVSADLERLELSHQQPNLLRLAMLQQLHLADPSLLPLAVEPVQLGLAAATGQDGREQGRAWDEMRCQGTYARNQHPCRIHGSGRQIETMLREKGHVEVGSGQSLIEGNT